MPPAIATTPLAACPTRGHVQFCLDDRGKTLTKDWMIFDTQLRMGSKWADIVVLVVLWRKVRFSCSELQVSPKRCQTVTLSEARNYAAGKTSLGCRCSSLPALRS